MNIHLPSDRLGDGSFSLVITVTPSDCRAPSAHQFSTKQRPFDLIDLQCSDTLFRHFLVSENQCVEIFA